LLRALGYLGKRDLDRGIRPSETTLSESLRARGYRTAAIGKWHLGHADPKFFPTRHGFDSFYGFMGGCIDYFTHLYGQAPAWYRDEKLIDEAGYVTELLTAEAVRYLEGRRPGQPFFLYLPFNAPHYGKGWDPEKKKPINVLQPAPKYLERVGHIPAGPRRDYAATIVAMDDGVGEVLAALGRTGLDKNTLVFWISDNGGQVDYGGNNYPYRGEIGTFFEGGIRVPAAVRWPGRIPAAVSSRQLGSSLDVFPTIARLAGADTAGLPLDGIDLAPVLFENREVARDLFWLSDEGGAFRRGAYKYVRNLKGEELLFHLASDPGEKLDLAGELPEKLGELKGAHARIARGLPPPPPPPLRSGGSER
jgi:arylsulfatase A-like enzyme